MALWTSFVPVNYPEAEIVIHGKGQGNHLCTPPLPWGLLLLALMWRMCRKQMLPHDFWVFVLMMSSTRLSFSRFNGGSPWFKIRWSPGFQAFSPPRGHTGALLYTPTVFLYTSLLMWSLLQHLVWSKSVVLSHLVQILTHFYSTFFIIELDLFPARQSFIIIHCSEIYKPASTDFLFLVRPHYKCFKSSL